MRRTTPRRAGWWPALLWCSVLVPAGLAGPVARADAPSPRTERVDVTATGKPTEFSGLVPAVSTDGRYVAFSSSSDDLVVGDTNEHMRDVFVRDRVARTTTRVSVATDGTQGNDESDTPAISGDGRYVAFMSAASNLVPRDENGDADVFVHDRATHETTRVSVSPDGIEGNRGGDTYPAISADGRFVAFVSQSTNLAPGTAPPDDRVFVHDRQSRRTSLVAEGQTPVSISADGRFVTFGRWITSDRPQIGTFARDRQARRTVRVDVSTDERAPRRSSRSAVISANGRHVAFVSDAGRLVAGDDNGGDDVFVRDLRAGSTTRVSIKPDGKPVRRCPQREGYVVPCADGPAISADGRYVAFHSELRSFGGTRFGGVFLRDRRARVTERVVGGSWEEPLAISGDGRYVAFRSEDGLFMRGPMR